MVPATCSTARVKTWLTSASSLPSLLTLKVKTKESEPLTSSHDVLKAMEALLDDKKDVWLASESLVVLKHGAVGMFMGLQVQA